MRTLALTTLVLVLATSPAWAMPGGHGGGGGNGGGQQYTTTTLNVVNDSDNAVACHVGDPGSTPIALEPHGSTALSFLTVKGAKNVISVTLTATIDGTTISDTETASIKSGNKATATITCPGSSISIAFSGGGLAKVALSRDSSVALASTGCLLPLLALSFLLGRHPRRRESSQEGAPTA